MTPGVEIPPLVDSQFPPVLIETVAVTGAPVIPFDETVIAVAKLGPIAQTHYGGPERFLRFQDRNKLVVDFFGHEGVYQHIHAGLNHTFLIF